MENINEEINRMKSLMSEERLHGNLVEAGGTGKKIGELTKSLDELFTVMQKSGKMDIDVNAAKSIFKNGLKNIDNTLSSYRGGMKTSKLGKMKGYLTGTGKGSFIDDLEQTYREAFRGVDLDDISVATGFGKGKSGTEMLEDIIRTQKSNYKKANDIIMNNGYEQIKKGSDDFESVIPVDLKKYYDDFEGFQESMQGIFTKASKNVRDAVDYTTKLRNSWKKVSSPVKNFAKWYRKPISMGGKQIAGKNLSTITKVYFSYVFAGILYCTSLETVKKVKDYKEQSNGGINEQSNGVEASGFDTWGSWVVYMLGEWGIDAVISIIDMVQTGKLPDCKGLEKQADEAFSMDLGEDFLSDEKKQELEEKAYQAASMVDSTLNNTLKVAGISLDSEEQKIADEKIQNLFSGGEQ